LKSAPHADGATNALKRYYKSRIGILEERLRQRDKQIDSLRRVTQTLRTHAQTAVNKGRSTHKAESGYKADVVSLFSFKEDHSKTKDY